MVCIVKPVSRSIPPRKPSTTSSPICRVWGSGVPKISAASGRVAAVARWAITSSAIIGPGSGRGRCLALLNGPDHRPYVRWTYRLEPRRAGTRVTEVWDVEQLPPAPQSWTQDQLAEQVRHTEDMLTTTLAALKKTAEG